MAEAKVEVGDRVIDSVAALDDLIGQVAKAQELFKAYSQEQVDAIFRAAALKANENRIPLAQLAFNETGMGILEDKVVKNHYASEEIYHKYKDAKTCGIIQEDVANGLKIVAEPLGVLAGVIPTTNPTSTVIFKSLIALKTRNAIIFSPHPRAVKSTIAAAKIMRDAAVAAGAPQDIIGWIDTPTLELTSHLMQHPKVASILATGGPGMVRAAYTSGKPAIGVGAGNVAVVIDETADLKMAVSSVILSKTFDNGMICASEQSVILVDEIYDTAIKEFDHRGVYFVNDKEKQKLGAVIFQNGKLNAKIVGQSAATIAEMAGFKIPEGKKILGVKEEKYDPQSPFAFEKLSPVLTFYKADDFAHATDIAYQLVMLAGAGHSSALYTDERRSERIDAFAKRLPTGRIIINSPSSHGGIGDLYNFRLDPSLTIGCGSWGNNSTSENVGIKHLLNYKTVAARRENMLWFKIPPKIYFKRGATDLALRELKGRKRAFIVTDRYMFDSGVIGKITAVLEDVGVDFQIFFDVRPDPTIATINDALMMVKSYRPDTIIAVGGGSPIDAAKIIWLMYEHPMPFEELAMRFFDIRKRICEFPDLSKTLMVAIPTTSGTGSEVTPFAVITDEKTHMKYPLADYALTPHMAIIDPNFVDSMPKGLTAASGIDALTHALESYVSVMATNFTNSPALEAVKLIFRYLKRSYQQGAEDPIAREKMHYASTLAGMAFANAFLGIGHSLAHKLGAAFNIAHGMANGLLICEVIKYNANDAPFKQAAFAQYKYPNAKAKYGQVADELNLGGKNDDEKVALLIKAIEQLKADINIPPSIKDYGIKEEDFLAKVDELAQLAFDDQCTGSNPAYPRIADLKEIYLKAYYGPKGK